MPQRTICVQSEASISIEHGSLKVATATSTALVPLEDIWVLILESDSVSVTSYALASLVDAGIGTMTCGRDHHPNGLLLPLGAHSRHAAIVDDQLAIPRPLAKQLWKRIVEQKIRNQAFVLGASGFMDDKQELLTISHTVLSGDSTNREAVAATLYFRDIIERGTRRNSPQGDCLDYGYAILRAGIAREAVAGGWLVSRGIHHNSDLNAFNLVDDLIEPFRPLVDLLLVEKNPEGRLDKECKRLLSSQFEYLVSMNGKEHTLQSAISLLLQSFKQAVQNRDASLLILPELIPLKICSREDQ